MEYSAFMLIRSNDSKVLERIEYYLDDNTRPEFDDDVPESEQAIFKAFEYAEIPDSIDKRGDNALAVYLEPDGLPGMEEMVYAIEMLKPDSLYYFLADDEDSRAYYRGQQLVLLEDEYCDESLSAEIAQKASDNEDKFAALDLLADYYEKAN